MAHQLTQLLVLTIVLTLAPSGWAQQQPPKNPHPTGGGSGTMGVGRLQTGVSGSVRRIQPARLEYRVTNPGGVVLIVDNGHHRYNPYAFAFTGLPVPVALTDGRDGSGVGVIAADGVITIGSPVPAFAGGRLGVFDGQRIHFGSGLRGGGLGVHGFPYLTRLDDVYSPMLIGASGPIDPRLQASGSSGGVPGLIARASGPATGGEVARPFADAMGAREWERAARETSDLRRRGAARMGGAEYERGWAEMAEAYREAPALASDPLDRTELGLSERDLRMLVIRSIRAAHRAQTAEAWLAAAALVQAEGRLDVARRLIERAEGRGLEAELVEAFERALAAPAR